MTSHQRPLRLHEELLLLSLHDTKGTILFAATSYPFALSGGLVAELRLAGRMAVEPDGKKLVSVVSAEPMGEPLLDECLTQIVSAKRPQSLRRWIGRFVRLRRLKRRVAEGMCDRGVLREEDASFLLFFTRRVYPTSDPRWKADLHARLRQVLFTESSAVDQRTVLLLSLAHRTGVLRTAFSRAELKKRKSRIGQILEGEPFGEAARAAMMAAAVAHGPC